MADMNYLTTLAYVKANMAIDNAKVKVKNAVESFNSDERGVEGFVVALILIGIAAILGIVFKDVLLKMLEKVIASLKKLFGDDVGNAPSSDSTNIGWNGQ